MPAEAPQTYDARLADEVAAYYAEDVDNRQMRSIQAAGRHGVGRVILVDDADYDELAKVQWFITGIRRNRPSETPKLYAYRSFHNKPTLMHRLLMNAQPGQAIDHVDGNSLNNQRANLRFATQSQNCANSAGRPHTSRFKGVFWVKDTRYRRRWWARIKTNGRNIHLGIFATEEEAARAYNAAAVTYFGSFAHLNEGV